MSHFSELQEGQLHLQGCLGLTVYAMICCGASITGSKCVAGCLQADSSANDGGVQPLWHSRAVAAGFGGH